MSKSEPVCQVLGQQSGAEDEASLVSFFALSA